MSAKKTVARKSKPKTPLSGPDLSRYSAAAEAVAILLHPHAEVVIHDLVNDRIFGIWNAFSNRKVGDPSNLLNDPELKAGQSILGPYEKGGHAGTRLKAISAALVDTDGSQTGLLCINLDMSKFDAAIELLQAFAQSTNQMPEVLFRGDLREQINLIVREELLRLKKSMSALTRDDRKQIVRRLEKANIFQARNAAPMVAAALGLGRANLYSILKDVRQGT